MKKRIGNPPKGVKYPVWDIYMREKTNVPICVRVM